LIKELKSLGSMSELDKIEKFERDWPYPFDKIV
jgi:hypothetical protein